MEPLDLTSAPPRSPRVQLDGLAMLARTIDKMRAHLPRGNPGVYHVDGMSERMLGIIGVSSAELQDVVARALSEEEVVTWVRDHADQQKYAQATHVMLNRSLQDIAPERVPEFKEKYPGYEAAASDKLVDILDADDAAMFSKAGRP